MRSSSDICDTDNKLAKIGFVKINCLNRSLQTTVDVKFGKLVILVEPGRSAVVKHIIQSEAPTSISNFNILTRKMLYKSLDRYWNFLKQFLSLYCKAKGNIFVVSNDLRD